MTQDKSKQSLQDALGQALKDNIQVYDALWHDALCDAIDEFVRERLKDADCDLWVKNGNVIALVALTDDVVQSLPIIHLSFDEDDTPEGLTESIAAIEKFVGELNDAKAQLHRRLLKYRS